MTAKTPAKNAPAPAAATADSAPLTGLPAKYYTDRDLFARIGERVFFGNYIHKSASRIFTRRHEQVDIYALPVLALCSLPSFSYQKSPTIGFIAVFADFAANKNEMSNVFSADLCM